MPEFLWAGSTEFPEFPWESQYQYRCRIYKIQQFTESLGILRATALANVWANYHFLGCSYPAPVLESIKNWDPPPKNQELEEKLEELQRLEQEAMYDKTLVNPSLKLKDLNFKMYNSAFEHQPPPVVLFYNSSQACKVPCSFVDNEGFTDGLRTVSLYINDIHVSDGRAANFKDAKHACAENALKYLKKRGLVIISPQTIDEEAVSQISKDSLTDKGGNSGDQYEENKLADDNVGCKLLKAMGWTADTGLGKDGQGRVNPISTVGQLNRGGLGSQNSEAGICHQSVKQQLLEFLRNSALMKLEFSADLDNLERKMIHRLSGKYGLKHKSRGSGANRRLVVWKEETSVSEMLAEPVTEFEEEEYGADLQMEAEEAAEDTSIAHYQTAQDDFHSLTLDPVDEEQSDIFTSSGKRKITIPPAQSKISRTVNVHFDYRNTDSQSQRGSKKSSSHRNRGGNSRTVERGSRGKNTPHQHQSKQFSKSRGPFREGYVDPYLAGPPQETYRRPDLERTTYRRPEYRAEEGYVPRSDPRDPRDPRTHHSSGFGIYRHMKSRSRR